MCILCVGDLGRVSKVLETQKRLANSQDKDGVTPLMLAANKGNVKVGIVSSGC